MQDKQKVIVIHPADNVGVALSPLKTGNVINYPDATVEIMNDIPYGFKVALADIPKGESIIKYGEVIGISSRNIKRGEKVHTHNCESRRGRGDIRQGQ